MDRPGRKVERTAVSQLRAAAKRSVTLLLPAFLALLALFTLLLAVA